jgi:hypothetical protein
MGVKRQQGRSDQPGLFDGLGADLRHDTTGDGGTGTRVPEESQASAASDPARALTTGLMEEVCRPGNLSEAYHREKANQGKPGIDGMTVDELAPWYRTKVKFLHRQGVSLREAWDTVLSGRRWWRLSRTRAVSGAMPNQWFEELGLVSLLRQYQKLHSA